MAMMYEAMTHNVTWMGAFSKPLVCSTAGRHTSGLSAISRLSLILKSLIGRYDGKVQKRSISSGALPHRSIRKNERDHP
jgi:hypothetical protein